MYVCEVVGGGVRDTFSGRGERGGRDVWGWIGYSTMILLYSTDIID